MNDVVLILGAGASKPYGFPLGSELKLNVIQTLQDNQKFYELGFQGDELKEKQKKHVVEILSRDPSITTIDLLLSRSPDLIDIIKPVVSEAILQCELNHRNGKFLETTYQQEPENGDWIGWVFNLFYEENHKIKTRFKLHIITYNYDRSLEFYFIRALSNQYDLSTQDAAKIFYDTVQILHMNGELGPLASVDDYGSKKSKQISFISEINDSKYSQELINDLLGETNLIVFLGLGYHQSNIKRLHLENNGKSAEILGTAFGIKEIEIPNIERSLDRRILLGDKNMGCLTFLSEKVGTARFLY